jgi:hypothetical protein
MTRGLPPPDPRSLYPLSSTEFVEPPTPEKNSWVGHSLLWKVISLCLPEQTGNYNSDSCVLRRALEGAVLGELGGRAPVLGTVRDGWRALETERLSVGAVLGELGGRAPVLGTPKDMLSKDLEMGVCFHRGPVLGSMGGAPFLRSSREG